MSQNFLFKSGFTINEILSLRMLSLDSKRRKQRREEEEKKK